MAKQYGSQLDLQKIPVLNLVVHTAASAPSSPVNGQVYYDTALSQLRGYVAGAWVQLDNVVGGTASNVADGDKGVITVTGGVWNLDNSVVTFAKMQNINNARLLGLGGSS